MVLKSKKEIADNHTHNISFKILNEMLDVDLGRGDKNFELNIHDDMSFMSAESYELKITDK